MRELKFRAWNKETRKMVDLKSITPLALSDTMNQVLELKGESGIFIPFCNGLEIMQFTGLKDKNGKDIYEGDILKYLIGGKEYWEEIYKLSYSAERACWQINCIKQAQHKDSPQFIASHLTQSWANCFEIVGNIHENPELLKDTNGNEPH